MQPTAQEHSYTLLLIEACLTVVAIVVACGFPRFQIPGLEPIRRFFSRLSRRKTLACISVGASLLLVRLALLPLFPVPHPFLPDDFSFLFAADTFLHGRLVNPTPAMWTHFETIHITLQPYASMYFPAPGLMLAAGKVLFGNPWAGLLVTTALMCGAICWMLQAWLPPGWALLGGFLAVLRIGLFSYWINTYTGGGSISALAGALVLGALPRLTRTGRLRYALLMGLGISILSISRPYEGVLVCLPVAVALAHWILFGNNCPPMPVLLGRAAASLALVAATLAWLGYYDYRAFGNVKTLPYTVDRATYAIVPYYVWQKAHPAPQYRHADLRQFYTEREARDFHLLHSGGVFLFYYKKAVTTIVFFAGFLFLPLLAMTRRVLHDRRIRFFVRSLPFWIVGMGIGMYLIPHYLAPFTAAIYVLGVQALRHLRAAKYRGMPVGRSLATSMVVACVALAGARAFAQPLGIAYGEFPINPWESTWIGPNNFGADRANVISKLEQVPGNHLVLVRYSPNHDEIDEWVYNAADIDGSRIIWAQDMDAASNEELIRHYSGRDVWLIQPDIEHGKLEPYAYTSNQASEVINKR